MFICFISVDRNEFMFDHMCANVLSKIQNVWDFLAMCYICIFALCNIYKSALRNYLKAGRRRLLGSTPYCHQTGLSVRIQIWGGGWQRRNNPKLSRLQLFTRKNFPDEGRKTVSRNKHKTSQELRMLSRSLSDCKSLLLNVIIQVSQFVRNSHYCH